MSNDLMGEYKEYDGEFAKGSPTGGWAYIRCGKGNNGSFQGCYVSSCPEGWVMTFNKYISTSIKDNISGMGSAPICDKDKGEKPISISLTCSSKWDHDQPVDCGNSATCVKCVETCEQSCASRFLASMEGTTLAKKDEICPNGERAKKLDTCPGCYICETKPTCAYLDLPDDQIAIPNKPDGVTEADFKADSSKYCGDPSLIAIPGETLEDGNICSYQCYQPNCADALQAAEDNGDISVGGTGDPSDQFVVREQENDIAENCKNDPKTEVLAVWLEEDSNNDLQFVYERKPLSQLGQGEQICAYKCPLLKDCAKVTIPTGGTPAWVSKKNDNNGKGALKATAEDACAAQDKRLDPDSPANPDDKNYVCATRCIETECAAAPLPSLAGLPKGGAWQRITPTKPNPTCATGEKISYEYVNGKKCFYRCECDDSLTCTTGSAVLAPSGKAGCTSTKQTNKCGTVYYCETCPTPTIDVCVGKEDRFCGGNEWIDCKGCIAGSSVDPNGNGTVSPAAAERTGVSGCGSTERCAGNPTIVSTVPNGSGTTPWTSQDYCKIFRSQTINKLLGRTQEAYTYFSCDYFNKRNQFFYFLGGNGGADAICGGCAGSAANFMAGPTTVLNSATNAGCQKISCPDVGNDELSYEAPGTCSGSSNCNKDSTTHVGRAYLAPVACSNGTKWTADSERSPKYELLSSTCGWQDRCNRSTTTRSKGCCAQSSCSYGSSCCTGSSEKGTCSQCTQQYYYASTCSDTPYYMDYIGSCGGTQQYGRQLQGAYKIIKKDLQPKDIWTSQYCDVDKNFTVVFDKGSNCANTVASSPGQFQYKPGKNGGNSFNPCECKVQKYTVTFVRTAAPNLQFKPVSVNGNTECVMRLDNDPRRNFGQQYKRHTDMKSGGYAISNGYYRLTPAVDDSGQPLNGKDKNGWEWNAGTCQFECGGCDDSALCYGKPPAYGDIEFVPDQRSTATYEYIDEPNCEQTGHQFGVHFNENTPDTADNMWVSQRVIENRAYQSLYVPRGKTISQSPFNYHEWITNPAGTGRNDYLAGGSPNGDKLYTVEYSWQIPDSAANPSFFRRVMVNGEMKCAVRVDNDPKENSQYGYGAIRGNDYAHGYAKSDGYFVITEQPENANNYWRWNDDKCRFEYLNPTEDKCYHQNRIAKALIVFEPDLRLNAAYVYDSEKSCGDSDEDIEVVFNDRGSLGSLSPWTVKRLSPTLERTNFYHELIVNQICTGANDYGIGRQLFGGAGCGAVSDRFFTVDFYYKGRKFAPMSEFGGQCAAPWSKNPDSDGVRGFGDTWGEAGRNGHLILTEHLGDLGYQANDNKEWYFNPALCRFEFVRPATSKYGLDNNGREVNKCEQKPLEAVGHIKFTPDLRVVVYNDPWYETRLNQSIKISGSEVGLKCSYGGTGTSYLGLNPGLYSSKENQPQIASGGLYLPADKRVAFTNPLRDVVGHLYSSENVNGVKGLGFDPASGTLNNDGRLFTMYPGENITRSPSSPYVIKADLTTNFDRANDPYYLSCVCPTLTNRAGIGAAEAAKLTGDCSYNYSPNRDIDICTTKRIYVARRFCYTAAWWQVSGGNVYAYGDIYDRVPPNASNSVCGGGQEKQCASTRPDGTGFVRDFASSSYYGGFH